MALMSCVQRRRSGVYEFRKRLPQMLAGKDVPAHLGDRFASLINASTGKFKHEFVQSFDTKERRLPRSTGDGDGGNHLDFTVHIVNFEHPATVQVGQQD